MERLSTPPEVQLESGVGSSQGTLCSWNHISGIRDPSRWELGVVTFDGYLQVWRVPSSNARNVNSRRLHAKAPSGDVQSGSGASSDCQRSQRRASQLSVLFRQHRALSRAYPSPPALTCDTQVHIVRTRCALHRWRSLRRSHRAQRSPRSRKGRHFPDGTTVRCHDKRRRIFTSQRCAPRCAGTRAWVATPLAPAGGKRNTVWHAYPAP